VAPRNGSAVGQVSSPFLDTKTVTSGTSEGSGESNSSIDVADPAVAPGTMNGAVGNDDVVFASNTKGGPNGIPHGGSAFTSGSFKAGVPRPEWG
jgi:hypothetical protein